jgi:hypothetical protein
MIKTRLRSKNKKTKRYYTKTALVGGASAPNFKWLDAKKIVNSKKVKAKTNYGQNAKTVLVGGASAPNFKWLDAKK